MARFFDDDFWGRTQQRMLDLGLTMTDLARTIKIPTATLYRQRKTGAPPAKLEQIERMAHSLGCTTDYLLSGRNKEQNTLSPEMNEFLFLYKKLDFDQRKTVLDLMRQLRKDNTKYDDLYMRVYGNEID